jgi:hypothetical protein
MTIPSKNKEGEQNKKSFMFLRKHFRCMEWFYIAWIFVVPYTLPLAQVRDTDNRWALKCNYSQEVSIKV